MKHFRTAVHGQTTAHQHDARRRNYLLPAQVARSRVAHQLSDMRGKSVDGSHGRDRLSTLKCRTTDRDLFVTA